MKINAAILCALLLLPPVSIVLGTSKQVNQQQFKVVMQGKNIGMLSTSQIIENSRITYLLHSSVKLEVLVKVSITENISDAFEHDVLVKSIQKRTVNDKVKSDNILQKNETGYQLINTSGEITQLTASITQSILSLYYEEPTDGDLVYSENFQQILPVQKIGQGKYCLELPNGNTSTYIYEKGKLQQVESQTIWGKVVFTRN
jgi:hypothetical protein